MEGKIQLLSSAVLFCKKKEREGEGRKEEEELTFNLASLPHFVFDSMFNLIAAAQSVSSHFLTLVTVASCFMVSGMKRWRGPTLMAFRNVSMRMSSASGSILKRSEAPTL